MKTGSWPFAGCEDPGQQGQRPLGGLHHVAVRRGPKARPDVGAVGEVLRDVSVQVESSSDGYVVADHRPHGAHQVSLAAPDVLDQHRSVEQQTHPVEVAGRAEPGDDLVAQLQIGRQLNRAARRDVRRIQDRHGLDPQSSGDLAELLWPGLEQIVAAQDSEVLQARLDRRRAKSFVGDASDGNAHGTSRP